MTTIEMTGMVLKMVTAGCKNIAIFGLKPEMIPSINPKIDAIPKDTINLNIVNAIACKALAFVNNLKNASSTAIGLGSNSVLSMMKNAATHKRKSKKIDKLRILVFFKYITF